MGGLDKKGAITTDEALNTRVQTITDRLITQAVRYRPDTAQWAWSVKVIQDPNTLNAFCMPGGKMAIYTGLIEKLDATDDEIALARRIVDAAATQQAAGAGTFTLDGRMIDVASIRQADAVVRKADLIASGGK